MLRRPPRSTQSRSSAASDVYKRQVIESAEVHTQTANLDLVISTDGSEKARIRSDAQTLQDRNRIMKLRARQHIDFTGIMTAGGPTTNVRSRWNMTIRKPTTVYKRRNDIALDTSEVDLETVSYTHLTLPTIYSV